MDELFNLPFKSFSKGDDESFQNEFSVLRKFGINDGDQSGVDVREGRRRCLSRDDGASENSATTHHVFTEELRHDEDEIAYVDLRKGEGGMKD